MRKIIRYAYAASSASGAFPRWQIDSAAFSLMAWFMHNLMHFSLNTGLFWLLFGMVVGMALRAKRAVMPTDVYGRTMWRHGQDGRFLMRDRLALSLRGTELIVSMGRCSWC